MHVFNCLLLLGDADTGKILCMSYAPKSAIDKGLKSNEWCGSVLALINGKGGGRPDNAQASGTNVSALKSAMEAAEAFAVAKLGVVRVQLKQASGGGDSSSAGAKSATPSAVGAAAVLQGPANSPGVQLVLVAAKYANLTVSFQPAATFSFQVTSNKYSGHKKGGVNSNSMDNKKCMGKN